MSEEGVSTWGQQRGICEEGGQSPPVLGRPRFSEITKDRRTRTDECSVQPEARFSRLPASQVIHRGIKWWWARPACGWGVNW